MKAEEQLEQWINRYQNLIFSICYKLTGSYFDSEDLTQDTFLSAYRAMERFDGANEKAWLTRIATNKCCDFLKSKARTSVPTEDETLGAFASTGPTPEEACMEQAVEEELRAACENLKEPYRSVCIAHFCEDRPLAEIAAQTGKSVKTLQTQIRRAKGMLKTKLRKELALWHT